MLWVFAHYKYFYSYIEGIDFRSTLFLHSQQTREIDPMLDQRWVIVYDAGPTLDQHWVYVSCLLGAHCKSKYIYRLTFTSESDVCRRHNLTSTVDPRAVRAKILAKIDNVIRTVVWIPTTLDSVSDSAPGVWIHVSSSYTENTRPKIGLLH